MPISHEHKCIFIHIPKCAGTSIESALGMHGAVKDVGIVPQAAQEVDEEHLWGASTQHLTAQQIRERVGQRVFDSYFKLAFVRNPWDRLVSFLAWKSDGKDMRWAQQQSPEKKEVYPLLARLLVARVDRRLRNRPIHLHLREQWRYVCDADGRLLVDFVGKFESLEADWAKVCQRIGIDAPLERRMVSHHEDYRSYYDLRTRALAHALYSRDIRTFDYEFGFSARSSVGCESSR